MDVTGDNNDDVGDNVEDVINLLRNAMKGLSLPPSAQNRTSNPESQFQRN